METVNGSLSDAEFAAFKARRLAAQQIGIRNARLAAGTSEAYHHHLIWLALFLATVGGGVLGWVVRDCMR
jgi:hypothetical protein